MNVSIPQPGSHDYDYTLNFRLSQILMELNQKILRTENAAWDGAHLIMGGYHIWIDATGAPRIKASAPTSDLDGSLIGGAGGGDYNFLGTNANGDQYTNFADITTGTYNVAIGASNLGPVTSGENNIAIGNNVLSGGFPYNPITGSINVGIGYSSLILLTSGSGNVAIGKESTNTLTTGGSNVCIGSSTGQSIVDGVSNTCIGYNANVTGASAGSQTAIGHSALSTKDNQVMLGTSSDEVACPGSFAASSTNSATVGAVTINKASGRCNIAASGTAVTVTNSLVATTSHVFAMVSKNDTTAYVKNVVPGSGSFTINLGAAATAEVSIDFFVVNPA